MQFKQGDKVVFQGEELAEVQFGPVNSSADKESYLVKWLEGTMTDLSSIVWTVDLEPVPKFKVGQVVRTSFPELFKVVAGPFTWRGTKEPFYVLEDPKGTHLAEDEDEISPVVE